MSGCAIQLIKQITMKGSFTTKAIARMCIGTNNEVAVMEILPLPTVISIHASTPCTVCNNIIIIIFNKLF